MREIKFRCWDRDKKEMFYPSLYGFEEMGIRELNGKEWDGNCDWMQFTGLTDKNGKKIYDGDILKHYPGFGCQWEQRKSKVIYRFASFWEDHGSFSFILDDHDQTLEVIGNVYENPELCAASQAQ